MNDEELLQKISVGDKDAFIEFFNKYKSKAFALLRSICKNNFDAEEALQDVFMKIYDYSSTFKGTSKVSTWLYTITYRTGLSYVANRKRNKTEPIDEFIENNIKNDSEQKDFIKNELLLKLVDELSEKQNIVLTLFYFNDLTIEEISQTLNISESDVKTTLHRARISLYNMIEEKNLRQDLQ
ncbi:MAG: RNA polymerase sigma factor [Bacteroidetes bacterium]|nr:RNA polymerase sigma factor [Bacteroidota bacterium]